MNVWEQDMFYMKEFLAPSPNPQLDYHPLYTALDCLFNIFTATLHIGSCSSICNLRKCHAVVTGNDLSWNISKIIILKSLKSVLSYFQNILMLINCIIYSKDSSGCIQYRGLLVS